MRSDGNQNRWRQSMSASTGLAKNLSRLHGFWIYKTFLEESQYWAAERREKYIVEHLRNTLIRAWQGTTYYRRLFKEVGFDPRTDLRSPSDISCLPLRTKSDIRQHFDDMIDHRFKTRSIASQTSGSTGEPLQMRLNESFLAFDSACVFRHWSWAKYAFRSRTAA